MVKDIIMNPFTSPLHFTVYFDSLRSSHCTYQEELSSKGNFHLASPTHLRCSCFDYNPVSFILTLPHPLF